MQQNANPGVKWGIVAGLALILLNVLSWIAGYDVLFSWWNGTVQFCLFIIFGILAGLEARKQAGGYISFKEILKPIFTTFVVGSILLAIYQYILYKFIDPNLAEGLKQHIMQATETMLHKFKAPQSEIDKQLDELNATDFKVSLARSFMDLLKSVIFYFAVSALLALILRKKNRTGDLAN
ncbi:MAG TPA: DUF4199 domain-containing protein [Chitinophaga sp.]|uniref:DUF4199 domain-containing protein n=1 Tax=Chitinophaga sp. TaxID=1869181 RepID=UPI002C2D364E|nr:DUF4199 domain-containing protein [Chitinophaga sp.]HVI46671.1 DUF4199 domain-containing protein [Chitinophaga sp.]